MGEVFIDQHKVITSDTVIPVWNLIDGTADFSDGFSNYQANYAGILTPHGNSTYCKDQAWNWARKAVDLDIGYYTFTFYAYSNKPIPNWIMRGYDTSDIKYKKMYAFDHFKNDLEALKWHLGIIQFKVLNPVKSYYIGLSANASGYKIYVGDYMLTRGLLIPEWNYSINDLRKLVKS